MKTVTYSIFILLLIFSITIPVKAQAQIDLESGLVVNVLSAVFLHHGHEHHDHNIRSA